MNPDVGAALRAAEHGDCKRVRALLSTLGPTSDEFLAVAVVAYLAGILPVRPTLSDARSETALWMAWLAIVERDAPLLRAALAKDASDDALRRRAYEHWLLAEEGALTAATQGALRDLESEARRAGRASLVLELACLQTLALIESGAMAEAVAVGRRASRMARTEKQPQHQYLANLALARVRRVSGYPHFAIRILTSLGAVVSPPWLEWVHSELALCGAPVVEGAEVPGRAAIWRLAMRSAAEGDREAFDGAIGSLAQDPGARMVREDARAFRSTVDPQSSPDASTTEWRAGAVDAVPHGLVAVADALSPKPATSACVVVDPSGRATRISSLGLALLPDVPIEQPTGSRGRAASGFPVLGAAGGDGLRDTELFEAVFGFPFDKVLHQNSLNLMIHRMRKLLVPSATIERDGDRVQLHAGQTLWIADPRCDRPVEDQLLRIMGRSRDGTSARSLAGALGVPLRSAQALLEKLTHDGECRRVGAGRDTVYRVEDTTFSEPTFS